MARLTTAAMTEKDLTDRKFYRAEQETQFVEECPLRGHGETYR